MAKERLCIPLNSLVFGRVFLEASFLASFSFVGVSAPFLYVAQFSCVSPYTITPPISASLIPARHLPAISCASGAGRRGIMEWWPALARRELYKKSDWRFYMFAGP
jgi:hypothetical protein